jgi:hypothetical protein
MEVQSIPPPERNRWNRIEYTEAIASELCRRIASGMTIAQACTGDDMPSVYTVLRWIDDPSKVEFSQAYARAREAQFEQWGAEIKDIADTTEEGSIVTEGPKGVETKTGDMTEHRKLRVESRKWLLGRLSAIYRERQTREISGPGGGPVQSEVALTGLDELRAVFAAKKKPVA